MPNQTRRRAVFLDRDGVINPLIYHRDAGIVDSPFTLAQFRILPGVPRAIRLFNRLGLAVVVVSNQPGVAKKHFGVSLLRQFNAKLTAELAPWGAHIDAIYYCLHHPDSRVAELRKRCLCRKPGTGMLRRAARELHLALASSYMVGDGLTDIEAGSRAGCRTVFIGRWKCEHEAFIRPRSLRPDLIAPDLWRAARLIRTDLARASGRPLVPASGV
ncbi:MAG: HAD family hydrolase [Acidobacteria bacterium]|nr:HAD family hydrolase [Acidobacteriota bacterium]